MDLDNLDRDPFEEPQTFQKVHIHIVQRNGRKKITLVSGIEPTEQLVKELKRELCCSGSIVKEDSSAIQFSGDQRDLLAALLVKKGLVDKENIILHG
jgi:translation initiation factor SUI1